MSRLAVFQSRSEALDLVSRLRRAGISATAVNTPRRLGKSCGLSVVFDIAVESKVRRLIGELRYHSLQGYYDR